MGFGSEAAMRIYLAQHGLAEDESVNPARPLSAQGREDVARVAGFLSLFEKPKPGRILHSGKLRAEQTASMFAEGWGNLPVEVAPDLAPNADPSAWSAHLTGISEEMMLVGHLPHLERLSGLLLCGDPNRKAVKFRNGGVVCLELSDNGWSVCWQVNPTLFYGEDNG